MARERKIYEITLAQTEGALERFERTGRWAIAPEPGLYIQQSGGKRDYLRIDPVTHEPTGEVITNRAFRVTQNYGVTPKELQPRLHGPGAGKGKPRTPAGVSYLGEDRRGWHMWEMSPDRVEKFAAWRANPKIAGPGEVMYIQGRGKAPAQPAAKPRPGEKKKKVVSPVKANQWVNVLPSTSVGSMGSAVDQMWENISRMDVQGEVLVYTKHLPGYNVGWDDSDLHSELLEEEGEGEEEEGEDLGWDD